MSKIEEYKSELVRIQDLTILDTVDLVERANNCDKETKVGRGDAFWLYKSANQTLAIAARIEQLLTAKQQTSINTTEDEEKIKEAEAEKLLLTVKKELTKRKSKNKKDGKEA
ncbi:Uncharacterised protein [Acinetobacter pittii]|uniref:hypothetical protein n=1 Tax=Acinetobacter pittii TaxID=48296 RepID=UPI000DE66347|nr:hypothetical protein [Acinetobacter pittii]SSP30258.1 Uncharacterised protein [Acinetobacter pittii]